MGSVSFKTYSFPSKNEWDVYAYEGTVENGKLIAHAQFVGDYSYDAEHPYGKLIGLKGWSTEVHPAYRRRGIASKMYQVASETFDLPISDGDFQTPEGEAFRKKLKLRQNPLLAKPPKNFHALIEGKKITRYGFPDPTLGVHTTDNRAIAAGYAYATWERGNKDKDYPVIVTLNVDGLTPESDTDAVLWWFDKGGIEEARQIAAEMEDGKQNFGFIYDREEDPNYKNVTDYLLNTTFFDWEKVAEQAPDEILLAIGGDHEAIRRILTLGFPQKRYLNDFDAKRVVKIQIFAPWEDRPVDFDALEDGELPTWAEEAQEAGYTLVDKNEIERFEPELQTIYKGYEADQYEYHGTTGSLLVKAFPELALPDPEDGWR